MTQIIKESVKQNCIIPAFNIFGYEDAAMVIRAAEELNAPVILMTNKAATSHIPIDTFGKMLCSMAEQSSVPVCVHLDHAKDIGIVSKAIQVGYTSVMYDGSQLPLEQNIENTQQVLKIARSCNVSVEAEIGSVGYYEGVTGVKAEYTDPQEAAIFAKETQVDALAVAVGTIHRMDTQSAMIDYKRLDKIVEHVNIPLVIHGATGIKDEDLIKLLDYPIGKINIGTALRMAFGETLRKEMMDRPDVFDRLILFQKPMEAIKNVVLEKYKILGY